MSSIALVGFGAISALGEGAQAASAGEAGDGARTAIGRDEELARAGLARPFAARAWPLGAPRRAAALLARALGSCARELDRARPGWQSERVGLVIGTSSGGMREAERAFAQMGEGRPVTDPGAATYPGPLEAAVSELRLELDPCVLVLGACASAALAVGLATRWLERDACDLVLAGGFDEVTVFVAAGFEALRATTASPPPRPFRMGRDGMALGEGAGVLALAREPERALAFVTGFGAASDARHLTAPDPGGAGLRRALVAALAEAGPGPVDLVSAHATATPYNDASEARALAAALGPHAAHVAVHPFKAQVGHTLGAAGALELLVCVDSMARGVLPPAAGEGTVDPDATVRLLARGAKASVERALKLASAFGGANAALVVSRTPGQGRGRRRAFVDAAAHAATEGSLDELVASTGLAIERLERTDRLVRHALAAVAALAARSGPLAGAGVVVGTALGPIETNAAFAARLRLGGARAAEPRRFPYTSPNAVAGECSIAFGLTGPSFAVGGGMHAGLEAVACAALLVEAGDADRMVVVAVDDAGPATQGLVGDALTTGAVAVLLTSEAGPRSRGRIGAMSLRRGGGARAIASPGHAALLPLLDPAPPAAIVAQSPPDVTARIAIEL